MWCKSGKLKKIYIYIFYINVACTCNLSEGGCDLSPKQLYRLTHSIHMSIQRCRLFGHRSKNINWCKTFKQSHKTENDQTLAECFCLRAVTRFILSQLWSSLSPMGTSLHTARGCQMRWDNVLHHCCVSGHVIWLDYSDCHQLQALCL